MQVTIKLGVYIVQWNGSNSALSPVVYGDIALSIKTEYNTKQDALRESKTLDSM